MHIYASCLQWSLPAEGVDCNNLVGGYLCYSNTDTLVKHRPDKKKSVTVFNLEREVFMCVSLCVSANIESYVIICIPSKVFWEL